MFISQKSVSDRDKFMNPKIRKSLRMYPGNPKGISLKSDDLTFFSDIFFADLK